MNNIKIGDMVDWADVPDGALVRTRHGYASRRGAFGTWNNVGGAWWPTSAAGWQWVLNGGKDDDATIVALGLSGQESADDLRRLAEVFEVRDAISALLRPPTTPHRRPLFAPPNCLASHVLRSGEDAMAERLHAAGWRPGMTADDAARLLA